jgi:hypothetical protein
VPRSSALPLLSPSFSSLILAFLPKCPACLVLMLAPLGIKVPGSRMFLAYVCVMAAGIPLAFFATPACRRCGIRPLMLAFAGLVLMTVGRVAVDNLAIVVAGGALMFAAAIWTARSYNLAGRMAVTRQANRHCVS